MKYTHISGYIIMISPFHPSSLSLRSTLIAVRRLLFSVHRDHAVAAQSLLNVLGFELAMLIVTIRLLDRMRDGVEHVRGLLENVVHLFQGTVAGLGEEEVDTWEHERVAGIVSLGTG